jgi:hypothetical protein
VFGSRQSPIFQTFAAFAAINYYPDYGEGILSTAAVHRSNRLGIGRISQTGHLSRCEWWTNEPAWEWQTSALLPIVESLATPEPTAMLSGANPHSWAEMFDSRLRMPRDSMTLPLQPSESHTVGTQNLNFADVISF